MGSGRARVSSPVINAFAGAGGWEVAARELGLDVLGIELDPAPVAVSRAAGFNVLQADVAALDPLAVMRQHFGARKLWGFVASAPCQPFSSAGKGAGRAAEDIYREAIEAMGRSEPVDYAALDEACGDDRAHLILEPLRWALALSPRWIALEQVPPVLPLWEAYAGVLRERGYSVWCGVLSSERYGVPQTRQRAILIASLDREVREPPATHQRYIAPRRRDEADEGLFAAPEPQRIVVPEDRELLPWVSMAEALSWGMTARPSVSMTAKLGQTGGNRPLEGGSGARETSPAPSVTAGGTGSGGGVEVFAGRESRARVAGAVQFRATNERSNGAVRDASDPAPALAFGHNPPRWVLCSGQSVAGEGRAERPADEPSGVEWVREGDRPAMRVNFGENARGGNVPRVADEPAATIHGQPMTWINERPSTSVNCDPRIAEPGRHDPDESGSQYGAATVRVSIEEAAALQSFPPGYPWEAAGTKTAAFRCVGNAVPPRLALHVLGEATGIARQEREAA